MVNYGTRSPRRDHEEYDDFGRRRRRRCVRGCSSRVVVRVRCGWRHFILAVHAPVLGQACARRRTKPTDPRGALRVPLSAAADRVRRRAASGDAAGSGTTSTSAGTTAATPRETTLSGAMTTIASTTTTARGTCARVQATTRVRLFAPLSSCVER